MARERPTTRGETPDQRVMRTLTISIGNTSLFGGVYMHERLERRFRVPVRDLKGTADLAALVKSKRIDRVALCSVVPALTPRVAAWVEQAVGVDPHVLTATAPHGLKIGYTNPAQLGADRLAAAIGVRRLYPDRDAIVVDCGTATTVTALRRDGTILGGAIMPGVALWPEMLPTRTAQLPRVALERPRAALARSTERALQSGNFFGNAGAIRELVQHIGAEAFGRRRRIVIGTGGNAALFVRENLFTVIEPDLILAGLLQFAAASAVHA